MKNVVYSSHEDVIFNTQRTRHVVRRSDQLHFEERKSLSARVQHLLTIKTLSVLQYCPTVAKVSSRVDNTDNLTGLPEHAHSIRKSGKVMEQSSDRNL